MKVAVIGANGVFGRHLLPRLAGAGLDVTAIVRRSDTAAVAESCGAALRVADLFDPDGLDAALEGCDICINLATSLPGPSGRGDYAVNDRVRKEGVPLLIEACARAGIQRLVQQSIAMVGVSTTGAIVDEDHVWRPDGDDIASRALQAALDMEAAVRASGLDWVILRGGLFYGPGTGFDDDWFARAAAGKLRIPGDGTDYVSLVHIADMAAATLAAVQKWPSRQTLIVSDDAPARWHDIFTYVAKVAGVPAPPNGGRIGFASFRVCNRRAKDRLGWQPRYPDFRAGLVR